MIDTIRFEVLLDQLEIDIVSSKLDTICCIDNSTGEQKSSFCKGSLLGSWDSRISCMVRNSRYVSIETEKDLGFELVIGSANDCYGRTKVTKTHTFKHTKKTTVSVSCPDYLVFEFSLSKWATGVNIGNCNLTEDAVRLSVFRLWLSAHFGFILPPIEEWVLLRVDMAYNYIVGDDDNVMELIKKFSTLHYQRRKQPVVYHESFYVPGRITTLKIYSKNKEFRKHDKKRFRNGSHLADTLEALASGILRFEIEFKKPKLDDLGIFDCNSLFSVEWGLEMKKELKKVVHGAMTTKSYLINEVQEILANSNINGSGVSKEVVLSVWLTVAMQGKTAANKAFSRVKVSRAMKVLERLGVSCICSITEQVYANSVDLDFEMFASPEYDDKLNDILEKILPFNADMIDHYYKSLSLGFSPIASD